MGKTKITFAPIPARAFGDPRLKGLHLKTLGVVALHDRLSAARKNGQGCWAGNLRLAEMIGCNYTNLSTALTDLATWGYIERRTNPMNKTRRILFIVYDERDGAFVKPNHDENPLPTGKQSAGAEAADNSLPAGKNSLPTGKDDPGIVCPDFQTSLKNQSLNGGEYIPQKRGTDSAEAGNRDSAEAGRDSAEAATFYVDAKDSPKDDDSEHKRSTVTGNLLGKIQTWLKALEGKQLTANVIGDLRKASRLCWGVDKQHGLHDQGPWAQRLAIDIDILLKDPGEQDAEPFGDRP